MLRIDLVGFDLEGNSNAAICALYNSHGGSLMHSPNTTRSHYNSSPPPFHAMYFLHTHKQQQQHTKARDKTGNEEKRNSDE